VEALLRWRHPVLGTVLPGELLPVADRLRLSEEIGEWVLHTACAQVAAWRRDGHDLWLALNVTARQVAAEAFVPGVAAALSIHQTPPERLVVEISDAEVGAADAAPAADDADSAPAADDADAAPAADDADRLPMLAGQLSRLRALGVRTALDDFGAGDTDLARLRRLPLDLVKLARPAGVGATGELARAVVDLTRRLGLAVVAEELETEAERELVRAAGCRYGQGNVVAPPAPAERIEAYLDSQRAPSR
jgi:EAL domain-containing protein (putative c-di-GMP-specific phosphodiesterase class I)